MTEPLATDEQLLYSFKEETEECGKSHSVEALFNTNSLVIETEDKVNGCCWATKGDTVVIPKRKITDYTATEASCCGCTPETNVTFTTTDEDPLRETGTKKKVSFTIKGKLDYEKLDSYVYGPLANAGDAIQVFSTLINDGLMAPIELQMDRAGMEKVSSAPPSAPANCILSLTGESEGVKTSASFRADAAVLDYEHGCSWCLKSKNHVVIPRYQLTNFYSTSEANYCGCAGDTVTIEQRGKDPVCGKFFPINHTMRVPTGTYNKAALISYIYGGNSGSAVSEAQHGASHLINARLAEPIRAQEDIMKLFAAKQGSGMFG